MADTPTMDIVNTRQRLAEAVEERDRAIREAALREAETRVLALRNDATGVRYAVLNEAANVISALIDKEPPRA